MHCIAERAISALILHKIFEQLGEYAIRLRAACGVVRSEGAVRGANIEDNLHGLAITQECERELARSISARRLRSFECRRKFQDGSSSTEGRLAVAVAMRLFKQLRTSADDFIANKNDAARGRVCEYITNQQRLRGVCHELCTHAGDAKVVEPSGHLSIGPGIRALFPWLTIIVVVNLRLRGRDERQRERGDG